MALIEAVGGVTLLTIASLWATMKAVSKGLEAGSAELVESLTTRVWQAYVYGLLAVLALSFGPGMVQWLTDCYNVIIGIL